MSTLHISIIVLCCGWFFCVEAQENQPDAQTKFVKLMVSNHQFDEKTVSDTLAQAAKSEKILESIAKPWEAKPWHQYYPIFLTEKRLNKGVEFWQEHQETLQRAELKFGVPAEIIIAIIGVETFYGSHKGTYPVLDALYTLGFYYPPRSKFFLAELEQLFLLAREEKFEITQLQGSYAGAMGWGQFISSSYRHYAIDFDGDGVRDLLNNPVDAIGSVANYFAKHGWQKDQAVAFPAQMTGDKYKDLISTPLKYEHVWAQLHAANISVEHTIDAKTSVKLFAFDHADKQEYWVALKNFYVITRYNHSPLYAMAVFQLSQQIKQQYINFSLPPQQS